MVWGCRLTDLPEANLVAKKKEAVLKAVFSWRSRAESKYRRDCPIVLQDKKMLEDERDSLSKDLSTKAPC